MSRFPVAAAEGWAVVPGCPRTRRIVALSVVLGLVGIIATTPATGSPLARFVDRTLAEGQDARDSLAIGFSPVQLPLIAVTLAADPGAHGVAPERVYQALTRWYFWAGQRWDRNQTGLWSVDPATVPVGAAHRGHVLAAHASLELAQLAALATLATDLGHVYDALVWWSDHAQLSARIDERLHDPRRGAYADLDSAGAVLPREDLDILLPLAFGAAGIVELERDAAWRLWTGSSALDAPSAAARAMAVERADALNGWTAAPGLRLFEPQLTASLLYAGVRTLADPALNLLVRDALGSVGLAPQDTVKLRMGQWTPRLALDDLSSRLLDRARTGVMFLDRAGVLTTAEADSLHRHLDPGNDSANGSGNGPAALERSISVLTDALSRWRAIDRRQERYLWENRRMGRPAPNGAGAAFRIQDGDLGMWVGRALDRITEDVIAFHLRTRERASWRAAVEPAVAGRGDEVELVLRAPGTEILQEGESLTLSALWTNGLRLLSPRAVELRRDREGHARGTLGAAPEEIGVWRLVLEGLPSPVRVPAAVAVVEPLQLRVAAIERRGNTASFGVEISSQLRESTHGRLEVQPPLGFTTAPATRVEFSLEGATSLQRSFEFTPSSEDGPGLYPVRWLLFDHARLTGSAESIVSVPFEWLRLGPLPPKGQVAIDAAHPPDQQVELARRFEGLASSAGWNRMPVNRVSPDGWVRLADAADAASVHYAFTAFTTGSRESRVRLEADGPAILRVNGREVLRTPDWGGHDRSELHFGAGTNYVLVKIVGGAGRPARFRLDLRDIDGEPLRGVSNSLDMLLDEMAYLARTGEPDAHEREIGRDSMRLMPFTYANPTATSVSVVGSFNGWSPAATRMVKLEDGRWQAKVRVRPGRFEYKFAVDGDQWIADPANPEAVSDGFGGRNSVLVVE